MAASYSIIPSLLSLIEGQTLQTTFQVAGVARGTVLYWAIGGTSISASDFRTGALSGQFTVNPDASGIGKFSLSHSLRNDLTTEGPETLEIKLFSNAARTVQVGSTAFVTILDTSLTQPRTYSITPSAAAVNEGLAVLTTVKTTNVPAGTVLYWALSGSGITAADFTVSALSGSAAVPANGQFSFSRTLANDRTSEGPETVEIRLFSDAARTVQVAGPASYVVNDTSTTATRTYAITPSAAAVNEGLAVTTTVRTTNVPIGTVLYWALSGSGITAADFTVSALSGSAAVPANGLFSFSRTLANDKTTEGPETVQIKLFSDAARTVQVVATASYVVNDTSLTPPPTFTISPSATSLNEGLLLATTVSTSNVPTGTSLYWQISGNGITSNDFSSGTLTGVGVIGSSGQFSLSHQLANDLTTEGGETLLINLYNDPALSVLLSSASVTVLDTSQALGPMTYTLTASTTTADEGTSVSMNVTTTNVVDGTILYYQIRGSNVDATDFSVGATMGQVLIRGGSASFKHLLSKDFKTEGDEVLLARLFSDKPGGIAIGNQVQVTVRDTSLAIPVTTEVFQPKDTPFPVRKWASSLPVPTLKRPDYVGTQPDIWGTNFAPQSFPGGQPGLYQDLDPTQEQYGGIAPEFYNQTVGGTTTPYYTTGQPTSWYSQRSGARFQVVVDGANQVISTDIYGYDSSFPGTTFKSRVGQPVVVRQWNDLPRVNGLPAGMPERISVHLHGAHNPAHSDGYPSFVVNPGMYRDYYYANTVPMGNDGKPDFSESPSTMWYHDHGEDITDLHVSKGLAGFFLTFDDRELDLIKNHVLPGWWKSTAEWNEQEFMENSSPYDIPLSITDRQFNADGSIFYDGFPIGNNNDGYLGDVTIINGKSYPYLYVEPTQYRLRMLAGSAARFWRLSIQNEAGVMQDHLRVGNDSWLLPHPIKMSDFILAPANRADLVMDFSAYAPGTVLYLVNTAEQHRGKGPQGELETIGSTGFSERVMKIVVGTPTSTTPTNTIDSNSLLRPNIPILDSEISAHRTFEFVRSNGMWLINQVHWDSQISNVPMPLGAAEEWTFVNGSGGWWHPVHVHLESHQLQTINGRKPAPDYFPEKQYKSDTTILGPGTTAKVYIKFRTFEGPFAFHCHTTQHEDSMMMFNFDPNLDGPTYKAGDPIPLDRNDTVFPFTSAHHLDTPLTGPLNGASGASHNHGSKPATPASTATPATAPPTISPLIVANFRHSAWGTDKSDLIEATAQDSYLNGRAGDDDLQGRGGNDMLVGGHGDDYIAGWGGDDLLAGEIGSDTLVGGAGRDGFYFITADSANIDLIKDFEAGSDFISLHHALVNTNGSGSSSWSYIGPDAFKGVKGEVRFFNSRLEVDLDGNRISDINVLMPGITSFEPSWLNVPAAASKGTDLL